jgi:hypothetical protein
MITFSNAVMLCGAPAWRDCQVKVQAVGRTIRSLKNGHKITRSRGFGLQRSTGLHLSSCFTDKVTRRRGTTLLPRCASELLGRGVPEASITRTYTYTYLLLLTATCLKRTKVNSVIGYRFPEPADSDLASWFLSG